MGAGPLGLEMGVMMPIGALIRHWGYAAVVGLLYPVLAARSEGRPRTDLNWAPGLAQA